MREDLLEAKACVDWAASNLPAFQDRLDAWMNENMHLVIKEQPTDASHNVLVAEAKEPLPLVFNAEAGAYINSIRSSLDVLATTLVKRYCIPIKETSIYFPVASSKAKFDSGKYNGVEVVQGLPATERGIMQIFGTLRRGESPPARPPYLRHRTQTSTLADCRNQPSGFPYLWL